MIRPIHHAAVLCTRQIFLPHQLSEKSHGPLMVAGSDYCGSQQQTARLNTSARAALETKSSRIERLLTSFLLLYMGNGGRREQEALHPRLGRGVTRIEIDRFD